MASLINEQLCINCGLCESTCKVSAIKEGRNVRYIDPIQCTGCGDCTLGCPIGAITRGHTVEELLLRKGMA